jgi:hypothetical protein
MFFNIFDKFMDFGPQFFVGFDERFENAGHILMGILHHI